MTGRAPTGQALAKATPANAVDGPSGFGPSRFTNARLAYAMRHIARRANDELGSHVQGMWNAAYCNADASERAAQVFGEIEAEIAHWKAIATEARRAETTGSVHEGAGPKDIAQKDQSHD